MEVFMKRTIRIIIIAMVLTVFAACSAESKKPEPVPTSPGTILEPTSTPTPKEPDFLFGNRTYVLSMRGAECREINIHLNAAYTDSDYYELIPGLIISDVDADSTTFNNDWIYCPDDWSKIDIGSEAIHTLEFLIAPPADTPPGEYIFTYEVKSNDASRTIEFKVKIL